MLTGAGFLSYAGLRLTRGLVGLGRHAQRLLPASGLASLPKPELAAESSRRRWRIRNGLPGQALLLVLAWNLLGGFLGPLAIKPADREPAMALMDHACWRMLWAFGRPLPLPALSRTAVLAADRAAVDSSCGPRHWIDKLPSCIGEDGSSRAAVQAIFNPIPSSSMRLHQLE